MKKILLLLLLSSLALFSRSIHQLDAAPEKKQPSKVADAKAAAAKKKPGSKKKTPSNANALLDRMQKATAYIVKTAKAPGEKDAAAKEAQKKEAQKKEGGKLDPKKKTQRPFWSALKAINGNVKAMKGAIAAKDPKFFKLLDETGRAVAEVNHGAQLLRLKDRKALAGVKALSVSYNELLKNFGKEAARKKKGGELSAAEKEQLAKMRSGAKGVRDKLKAMQTKLDRKKNARLYAQLMDLIALSSKIDRLKGDNLNAYIEMLYLVDYLTDDWYSYGQYLQVWDPALYTEWTSYSSVYESYYSYYETSYTSIEYTDWSAMDSSVEVVDAESAYDIEVSNEEIASSDSLVESYSEETSTAEMTAEETAAEAADTSENEDVVYDTEDDDDGDGLEDADDTDDDGDGVPDEKDTDDDNDGVADDDSDGDGTPDAQDDDDDNDGVTDAQDDDDDNDGVSDADDDDTDNDGIDDDQDTDDDNDGVPDAQDDDDDGDGTSDAEDTDDGGDDGGDE